MSEIAELQQPSITDICSGIIRKCRVETPKGLDVNTNLVIGELDSLIDKSPQMEDELIAGVCDSMTLLDLKMSPADLIAPAARLKYATGVMHRTQQITTVFEDARAIGRTVAAGNNDDFAALEGSFGSIRDSHPELKRMPIRAWAEAVAKKRFPRPAFKQEKDEDEYKAILAAETQNIVNAYTQADRRRRGLDSVSRKNEWADVEIGTSFIQQEGETLPAERSHPLEVTPDDLAAMEAYNTLSIPEFMKHLYSLDEETMHHAIRYVTQQIAHSQLPFTENSFKPPRDIPATPLILRYFRATLEAQQREVGAAINRWGEMATRYDALTSNATPVEVPAAAAQ